MTEQKDKNYETQYYLNVFQPSVLPNESDLAEIKAYFSEDSNNIFEPKEIAIFEGWISNNVIDRSMNRLPLDTLKSLSETIVGKPKIIHHDVNRIPDGRFFKSRLEKVEIDDALKIIGAVPFKKKDFQRILEISSERDGGLYWLVATFYMLQGTEEEKAHVRKVRAGLLRDMSLSFYVPKRVAILEDDSEREVDQWSSQNVIDGKKVLFYEWRNSDDVRAEAVEGSHVFLGRLRGTISQQEDFQSVRDKFTLIINHYDGKTMKNDNFGTKVDSISISEIQFRNKDIDIENQYVMNDNFIQDSEWSAAYINSLEDDCFAVVENTGQKDDEGKTVPRSARHLPHHPKGKGHPGAGGELDMPHFRNALARLNQIKPVTKTISREGLIEKARKHLEAHRAKLEKETSEKSSYSKEIEPMDIKLAGFEKPFTLLPDSFEEDVTRLAQAVNNRLELLISENQQLRNDHQIMKNEIDKLRKFTDDFKQAFGEMTINQLAQLKADAAMLKDFLIKETLTFKRLAGFNVDEKSAEGFQKMSVETIMEMLNEFRSQVSNTPGYGWLAGNFEEKIQNESQKPEKDIDTELIDIEKFPAHYRKRFML